MVPSAFVTMREFPLTPNGKVDRKALPAPQSSDYQQERKYVAPRERIEKRLVSLWEDVLNVRPIGVKDGFFELGGRSLLAARLFIKIAHKFGRELPLTTLIHAPTVEMLANELRPTAKTFDYPTLVPMKTGGRPPFFCVHGGALCSCIASPKKWTPISPSTELNQKVSTAGASSARLSSKWLRITFPRFAKFNPPDRTTLAVTASEEWSHLKWRSSCVVMTTVLP